MSFAEEFSEVTMSFDFDKKRRMESLIGSKPTKDSIIISKDSNTLLEVIVTKFQERKLFDKIKELEPYGTKLCASRIVFPQVPKMVLREFRP